MDIEVENPLLPAARAPDSVDGAVDRRGRPVKRTSNGGWGSATFIIGVEIAERVAYGGVSANLVTYLTSQLGKSTANAAANVSVWLGASYMLPLLGGLVADSCLGRYTTIAAATCLYLVSEEEQKMRSPQQSLSTSKADGGNGVIQPKVQPLDLYADFRASLQELILSHGWMRWGWLQDMLEWYIQENGTSRSRIDKAGQSGDVVHAFVDMKSKSF